MKLKIPTSPESDGEIYLTPNNSVTLEDDKCDSGMEESCQNVIMRKAPHTRSTNGYRMDKIQSMSSISNKLSEVAEDQVDSGMDEKCYCTTEDNFNGGIFRMKSLGNLSQYERSFGATPKSLLKLKEDFESRRLAMIPRRKSLTNLLEANDTDIEQSAGNKFHMPDGISKREMVFFTRPNQLNGKYKKKFGIGDTKYIGTDADTPEQKHHYHLTKMKSLGTIPDLINERVNYDPFLTPMVARKHPASLHSFKEERKNSQSLDSNGSSDLEEQEDFLRHQPDEHVRFMNEISLLKGSFERGFRRSYNKKHERTTKPTTPLRQSDGYFHMPHLPVKKGQRQNNIDRKNRSSVHSLPSDGKLDTTRYDQK